MRLHRVLAGAAESLDSQMLLDPFEEQLHLPALGVQGPDQFGFECEIVDQKHGPFARFVSRYYAAQCRRIVFVRVKHRQHTRLIADQVARSPVHWVGVASLGLRIAFGASDKESLALVDHEQELEVQVSSVEQIKRSCLDCQLFQRVDLVGLAIGDMDESWDAAPQVQQCVQPHSRLGTAKRCPRKYRQTQTDGRHVESVHGDIQIDS